MTKINLHGILKYEFGKIPHLNISRPREVVDAIDSIRSNFRARINELARENIHFETLIDGKRIKNINEVHIQKEIKIIDIIPVIAGGFAFIPILTQLFLSVAVTAVSIMIQSAMTSNTSSSNESRASASVANADSSFIISTNTNLAQQGSPIPVGYGRLRTGGYIIQSTVKSYPKSQEVESVLAADPTSVQITTNTY